MSTDADIVAAIDAAFADVARPDHFYRSPRHCDECAEHDELLRTHDRFTLTMEQIGHMSWDPVTGASPHGFAYLLPALVRLVFSTEDDPVGWYGEQFLFHLERDGKKNERWLFCTTEQRAAVAAALEHIIDTRAQLVEQYMCDHQAFRVLDIWRENE